MSNNIINQAVAKVNEELTLEAVRKAQGIIGNITREQASKATLEVRITEDQKALVKIKESELTFELVYGRTKPASPSTTEATIIKSIEELVKANQQQVEQRAASIGANIAANINGVKAIDERITALRDELAKVATNTVTAAAITGNQTTH